MAVYRVEIYGKSIEDKNTHYEAYPSVALERATVTIRSDIAAAFQKKYNLPITKAEKFRVNVDLISNGQRVRECQHPNKSRDHLMGSIGSIDDIAYSEN